MSEQTITPEAEQEPLCRYPDCPRPPAPKDPTQTGPAPKYCSNPDHNPITAFRAKQKKQKTVGAVSPAIKVDEERPVSSAAAGAASVGETLIELLRKLVADLPQYVQLLEVIGDTEAAELQVNHIQAQAQSAITQAQQEASAERKKSARLEKLLAQARDDAEEANGAAAEAVEQLDAARQHFETQIEEIRTQTQKTITDAQEAMDQQVKGLKKEADDRVDEAQKIAGDALTQVEAMKKTVEREKEDAQKVRTEALAEAEDIKTQALAEAERIRTQATDAQSAAEERAEAAERSKDAAEATVEASKTLVTGLKDALDRMTTDATRYRERVSELEPTLERLLKELDTAQKEKYAALEKVTELHQTQGRGK
ncbi:hypothetical protein ACFYUJ_37060 [Streptomyces sp. NPDC004520]|uniref:hypothetical protein n=1 Tax=Streptomyces sp. NPDC004520 TaxID=3364702 RepID=UPI0036947A73